MNINSIHGGQAEPKDGLPSPVVADSVRAVIDRRFLVEETLEDVKGEVRGLLERLARDRPGEHGLPVAGAALVDAEDGRPEPGCDFADDAPGDLQRATGPLLLLRRAPELHRLQRDVREFLGRVQLTEAVCLPALLGLGTGALGLVRAPPELAAEAYNAIARLAFGEFAYLNDVAGGRTHCLRPDNCGSYGAKHCGSCERAARESEAA